MLNEVNGFSKREVLCSGNPGIWPANSRSVVRANEISSVMPGLLRNSGQAFRCVPKKRMKQVARQKQHRCERPWKEDGSAMCPLWWKKTGAIRDQWRVKRANMRR